MPVFRPEGSVLTAQGNALGMVFECTSALTGPFKVQCSRDQFANSAPPCLCNVLQLSEDLFRVGCI